MIYKLTDVAKSYQAEGRTVRALNKVNLEIPPGEWLAVKGRSGQGKSTLLQMLGGLDRPTSGSVEFTGTDLAGLRDGAVTRLRAESIGFVFQSFNLLPTLTARENVEAALVPLGVGRAERRERAAAALADVGLAELAGQLPGRMSGGEQQRVGIARALVKRPKVLLADEPTGSLDRSTRDEIADLLAGIWREQRLTLVMVTHDPELAARAERVLTLKKGRVSTE